jgi:hypothetical protein
MGVPVLFLDVDGPLIPFGSRPGGHPTFLPEVESHPLLARLDPRLGLRLSALGCELVWATSWMDEANDGVAPRLGLPQLPVVTWSPPSEQDALDERAGLNWKTRDLCAWAAERCFVWIDDEITDADRAWVSANHPRPTLLLRVDPRIGLLDADMVALDVWLREARPDAADC